MTLLTTAEDDDMEFISSPRPQAIIRLTAQEPAGSFQLVGTGGRCLLKIGMDGTVSGEIEDASEAAAVFVNAIRGQIADMLAHSRKVAE